jgi:hypothetical protein
VTKINKNVKFYNLQFSIEYIVGCSETDQYTYF